MHRWTRRSPRSASAAVVSEPGGGLESAAGGFRKVPSFGSIVPVVRRYHTSIAPNENWLPENGTEQANVLSENDLPKKHSYVKNE
jgi:hypothetical protein